MNKLYKYIALVFGIIIMCYSCSKNLIEEEPKFIPENPNSGAAKLPPNPDWAWVGKYPGEVNNSIKRLNDVEVAISADYKDVKLNIVASPRFWQSSGLYVPPAEEVIVNVPNGIDNLHYQIGVADILLSESSALNRSQTVVKTGKLSQGKNSISSNFGGNLYFFFEGAPQATSLKVSGAVKSLDYKLDETDLIKWREQVSDTVNPMIWGELIGKRAIFTLPINTLRTIERPDVLLKYYDELIEKDFDVVGGLDASKIQVPWRIYSDIQLPVIPYNNTQEYKVYAHYPMGFKSATADSLSSVLVKQSLPGASINDGLEFLKGFAQLYASAWNTSSITEPIYGKVAVYHNFQRKGKWSDAVSSLTKAKKMENRYEVPSEDDYKSMLTQLLQEYGWGIFKYASSVSSEEMKLDVPDQYKNDLLAMYASDYAGKNLEAFFDAWSFPISEYAIKYISRYPDAEDFWSAENAAKIPSLDYNLIGTNSEKTVPLKDTLYVAENWKVDASSDHSEGRVVNLLDGNPSTYWHSDWADGSKTYPHYFSFEFEEPLEFNYVYLTQRINPNPGPKTFIVQIKKTKDGGWEEVSGGKRFYLQRNQQGKIRQKRFLNEAVTAYGVKVILLEGLERSEGNQNPAFYVAVADFGIGLLK